MVACGVTTAAAYVLIEEQARKLAISTPPPQYPSRLAFITLKGRDSFPSIRCQALSVARTHPALIIWCELTSQ
jgi:hypothetical protein